MDVLSVCRGGFVVKDAILHKRATCYAYNHGLGSNSKVISIRNSTKKHEINSEKKFRRKTIRNAEIKSDENNVLANDSSQGNEIESVNISSLPTPRVVVLKACTITSSLILTFGAIVRQVSHSQLVEGWTQLNSTTKVTFDLELWHLGLITGLVVSISSCRYFLLKIWPDFAESSEAANHQVLTLLEPLDYAVVSFLPGISEEFLFRGALMPLFGLNWESAFITGALFGVLHLSGGRRYSFAIWATLVGFAYGLGTVASNSLIVPMISHSLNNLIGAILWRYSSTSSKKSI